MVYVESNLSQGLAYDVRLLQHSTYGFLAEQCRKTTCILRSQSSRFRRW